MALMQVEHVSKQYCGRGVSTQALRDLSLTIEQGELTAIVGSSGSGKSTLMNILGALDTPTEGRYLLRGEDVSQLTDGALSQIRNREIGWPPRPWNRWGWGTGCATGPISSPADSSSGWPSQGPLRPGRPFCWQMSRRATWIPRQGRGSCRSCAACTSRGAPWSLSPMTPKWRRAPTAKFASRTGAWYRICVNPTASGCAGGERPAPLREVLPGEICVVPKGARPWPGPFWRAFHWIKGKTVQVPAAGCGTLPPRPPGERFLGSSQSAHCRVFAWLGPLPAPSLQGRRPAERPALPV